MSFAFLAIAHSLDVVTEMLNIVHSFLAPSSVVFTVTALPLVVAGLGTCLCCCVCDENVSIDECKKRTPVSKEDMSWVLAKE